MPKVSPQQSNLNSGELSPLLAGRTDFDKYPNALKICLNMIPYIQGGLVRRPGTYFSDEVKDSSKAVRLIRFKYSTTQAYAIEFGDLYIRFKRNNNSLNETPLVITGITQANPGVLSYTGTDPSNGDHIDLSDIVGMTELNLRRVTVANVDTGANTFELSGIDTTSFSAYVSGGEAAKVYEIVSPYTEAQLFELEYVQSADVLYIFHKSHATMKLTRTTELAWTLTAIDPKDGAYLPTNSGTTTLTPAAATGSGINIVASAVTDINDGQGFLATDVGRLIRIKHGSTWGYAKITVRNSTTSVDADIINDFGGTTASAFWRLGLWSDTTGYAASGTFHEDRLFMGGHAVRPERLDGSRNGQYENFAPTETDGTVADDNAVSRNLSSDDVQNIRWMKGSEKGLLIGTVEGEWIVRPSTSQEAISPTNIDGKQSTGHGSLATPAIRAGKAILFVQKSGRKIRELAYVFEVDGFRSPDLTVLSEHITRGGVKEMAYQQEPQSLVWSARNDGLMIGFTYERDQEVLGWHRHTLGGFSDAAQTKYGLVESVCSIPAADGSRDEVWMVVKRYINGQVVRYVEYMSKVWEQEDEQADSFHFDSGLTYDGALTDTISGLHHLVGETVSILADGAVHPDKVVSANGTITLDYEASKVQVGYKYNSDIQTLRIEAGAADGTAQGKTQRIHRIVARVLDTGGMKSGSDFEDLESVTFREGDANMDMAVPLFTGDIELPRKGDYSTEELVTIRFDTGLPGTILGIYPQLHTQDR